MTVLSGILHDTYHDENGKEISYTQKIVAVRKRGFYKVADVPDFNTFQMSSEDFKKKVTEVKEI